ncbi:translesion error-prone DNA polymerase V autoproteolytic subunit [Acinetobacter sp. SM34]|uniref:LexA family protein n=1 Tax=Acinetobacter sp. SM34 TaxID=1301620 RepID=UPI001EDAF5E8|nr:translesion error-prone DNA polymerase V autoproteolytic subunit [Acinetobacter sp. SM34]MCG2609784.1 translesion error-prone DNA polymerase V autoproteolytic subunit [Acinetobacter sp. SM34]
MKLHDTTESTISTEHGHGGKRKNAGRKTQYQEKTVVMRVPESKVLQIKSWLKPKPADDRSQKIELHPIQIQTQLDIPYPLESVAAGFPSPAQDYAEDFIDLNRYLVHNPSSTFVLRVNSLSMKNAGIDIDDQILIDRSLKAEHGDIVLALINNDFTVKRLMIEKQKNGELNIWLKAENPEYPDIYLHSEEQLIIWGVVTCILKKLR